MYALFGGNIAHFALNWKEDAIIFRRSKHGAPPVPISQRYARWGRTIRAVILSFWFITEIGYAFYDKIVKCRWNIMDGIEEQLDDFDKDKCSFKNAINLNKTVEDDKLQRWWCYTQTCYSAHIYGFFAGKHILYRLNLFI